MSPRSAFEEISEYHATAHILSGTVLDPPPPFTVDQQLFGFPPSSK